MKPSIEPELNLSVLDPNSDPTLVIFATMRRKKR